MQHAHNHQLAKRQATSVPVVGSFSGSATATGNDFGSSLLVGSSETSAPVATDPLVAGQPTMTITSSSTSTQTDAPSSSSSSHPSASVSTGAVVGITVGVFLVVIGAMFAVYSYFKRRTLSRARRAVARGPPPVVRGAERARDQQRKAVEPERRQRPWRGQGQIIPRVVREKEA